VAITSLKFAVTPLTTPANFCLAPPMSRRAIKRYEAAIEKGRAPLANREEDSDSLNGRQAVAAGEPHPVSNDHGVINMFDLLHDEEEEAGVDEEGEDGTTGGMSDPENEAEEVNGISAKLSSGLGPGLDQDGAKRRRRKKKKKKNDGVDDDEDWFIAPSPIGSKPEGARIDDLPDVADLCLAPAFIPDEYFYNEDDANFRESARALMKEIIEIAHPDGIIPGAFEASARASRKLMAVDPRMLNSDVELKQLFGARVVESERRAEEYQDSNRRIQRQRGQHVHGLRKRNYLVKPRDTWFSSAPGLVMVPDNFRSADEAGDSGGEIRYFRYAHESQYERVQEQYRAVVSTHDPNLLVDLIRRCPFHVDTLLQLAEVYRQTGEPEHAGELIERALFVLENSWHRSFKPFDGEYRLRFAIPENRSLFISLFRYVQLTARRGLQRTALEGAKLLLNLDPPGDPLGVLMTLDSLALLSGEYDWICAMHSDYHHVPLEFFPNFALSSAGVVRCRREARGGTPGPSAGKKKLPEYRVPDDDESRDPVHIVSKALLAFPMVLRPLLEAMKESTDICSRYKLFEDSLALDSVTDGGALLRISRIYAESSKLWWSLPDNMRLLLDAAVIAGASAAGGRGEEGETAAAEGLALRQEAALFFRNSGLYEDLQVADFSESRVNIPQELLQAEGPAPPHPVQPDATQGTPGPLSARQAAIAFLESFLPWRDANVANPAQPEQNRANPPAGFDRNIWEQLQRLLLRQDADPENEQSDE
jgi:hypothetical protein